MKAWLHQVYNAMPAPVRSAAATARGYYLRSWRYGADTERLVQEYLGHEQWGPEDWSQWRLPRLETILLRASVRVPFYREQWGKRRAAGDMSSAAVLESWPVLEKADLRRNPMLFVADDCDPRKMHSLHTSGTSGKPLTLWRSLNTNQSWYALFEARGRRWYGVSREDRWANIGGQLVTPVEQRKPPFWVWNQGMRQLYMSSYHLAPDLVPFYLEALHRYRIRYLWGYSSSLHSLAQGVLRAGVGQAALGLGLKVALTNAEPVYRHQRDVIERAFGCPVRETYGMAEIAVAASECEHGSLHEWPEAGLVEILDDGVPVPDGQDGDIVATTLLNPDMPLIRYRVGDRAIRQPSSPLCACGRRLPRFQSIEGRIDDVLFTMDGRRIGRLDPVFKSDLPIEEAQIIQESLSRIVLKYVPAAGFSDDDARSISDRIRERMGPVEVHFERVDHIPRGANGKFRAVVCQLPEAERGRVPA